MAWSVLLLDERMPVDAARIGRLVARAAGGVAYDRIQRVRLHHGWVARGLEEDAAARVVEALEAAGIRAVKVDEASLHPIGRRVRIHRAAFIEEALLAERRVTGAVEEFPWSDISLVSLGRILETREEKTVEHEPGIGSVASSMVGPSGHIHVLRGIKAWLASNGPRIRTEEVVEETLLLHLAVPSRGAILEIRPDRFDYGCLGGRQAATWRPNLLLLLEDLGPRTPAAHRTDMTELYLSRTPHAHTFRDARDFLAYNLWLIETRLARGSGAGDGS